MQRPPISIDDFKQYYNNGEFDYSKYNDSAIQKNIDKADMIFAYNCFNDNEVQTVYSFLVAHYLLKSTSGGFNNIGFQTSQSTNDISVSFEIPQWIKSNPLLQSIAETTYGMEYLTILQTRKKPFIMARGTVREF
jgi:hypothetical protein